MDEVRDTLIPSKDGQLILKPANVGRRWPSDDALFLHHGLGLARKIYCDCKPPLIQGVSDDEFQLEPRLIRRIKHWAQKWRAIAKVLPPHYTPAHCREFDIQSYNREALAICRDILPLLPSRQQLCYSAAKRKGCFHQSYLTELAQGLLGTDSPGHCWKDGDLERWVRVMSDYGGSGLWNWDGAMDVDQLPVPTDLKQRIEQWGRHFVSWSDSWHPGEADSFARLLQEDHEIAAHAAEGLEIARAIKAYLPEWTVSYFDSNLCGRHVNRSKYQFEVV